MHVCTHIQIWRNLMTMDVMRDSLMGMFNGRLSTSCRIVIDTGL